MRKKVMMIHVTIYKSWKTLLVFSNEELKIDAEFTREDIKAKVLD